MELTRTSASGPLATWCFIPRRPHPGGGETSLSMRLPCSHSFAAVRFTHWVAALRLAIGVTPLGHAAASQSRGRSSVRQSCDKRDIIFDIESDSGQTQHTQPTQPTHPIHPISPIPSLPSHQSMNACPHRTQPSWQHTVCYTRCCCMATTPP